MKHPTDRGLKIPRCTAVRQIPRRPVAVRCHYPEQHDGRHYACVLDKDGHCIPGHWPAT